MKKLIAIVLAVSTMFVSTSVFAEASVGTLESSRYGGNALSNGTGAYPCFRNGDILNFDITGATSGGQLTLISYKNGAEKANNTIQYINQWSVGEDRTVNVKYAIRDLDDGIYCLVFKDGQFNTATFYYKVVNPTAGVAQFDGKDHVDAQDGRVYLIYAQRAQGVTFVESGYEKLVVTLTANSKSVEKEVSVASLDTYINDSVNEIEGYATALMTLGVTAETDISTATITADVSFKDADTSNGGGN